MAQKSELQRRVIQEHKINIEHCLLFLEVIGNFCVPSEFQKNWLTFHVYKEYVRQLQAVMVVEFA